MPPAAPAPAPLFRGRVDGLLRSAWFLAAVVAGIFALDLATGTFLLFPILFVLPVTLMAATRPLWATAVLAVALPAGRVWVATFYEHSTPLLEALFNAGVRAAVLLYIAWLVARLIAQREALATRVQMLEGILPICMYCKKIRDEEQKWEAIDSYIHRHTAAEFSHGICPECVRIHHPKVKLK